MAIILKNKESNDYSIKKAFTIQLALYLDIPQLLFLSVSLKCGSKNWNKRGIIIATEKIKSEILSKNIKWYENGFSIVL